MSADFADTNVVLYLLDDGPKAERAAAILAGRPRISVQVLNEAMVNCRRKAGLSWDETGVFLAGIRALCPVEDVTLQTHDVGRALAERYGWSVYDAISSPPRCAPAARGCGARTCRTVSWWKTGCGSPTPSPEPFDRDPLARPLPAGMRIGSARAMTGLQIPHAGGGGRPDRQAGQHPVFISRPDP